MIGQIKEAIRASGKTMYRLSKDSKVGTDSLYRFMDGERNLSLEAAEKVCQALRLKLTPEEPPGQARGRKPKGPGK